MKKEVNHRHKHYDCVDSGHYCGNRPSHKKYYFWSLACKEEFDAHPEKYAE